MTLYVYSISDLLLESWVLCAHDVEFPHIECMVCWDYHEWLMYASTTSANLPVSLCWYHNCFHWWTYMYTLRQPVYNLSVCHADEPQRGQYSCLCLLLWWGRHWFLVNRPGRSDCPPVCSSTAVWFDIHTQWLCLSLMMCWFYHTM